MNNLTRLLTLIHKDLPSKSKFRVISVEKYIEEFEERYQSCDKVKVPIFYHEGVDIGQIEGELVSNYIELYIENAGYRQVHEYLLTSVIYNRVRNNFMLTFTGKFSNWAPKRIVVISSNYEEILRNDFRNVYELSWKDFNEDKYQKVSKCNAPKLRKRTLTAV